MFGRGPKKSDNTRYYEILRVCKNLQRMAAIKSHPLKGGDPEKKERSLFGSFSQLKLMEVNPKQNEQADVEEDYLLLVLDSVCAHVDIPANASYVLSVFIEFFSISG